MATIILTGKSGKQYRYEIFGIDRKFRAVAGNYAFAAKTPSQKYSILYAGETRDFSERFNDQHEGLECSKGKGATHVIIRVNSGGSQARLDEETDIRQKYTPDCNKQ